MHYGHIPVLKHLRPKKLLKTIKFFHYALGFTICQSSITAQTLTLMQGSKRKNKTCITNLPQSMSCNRVQHELNPNAIIGRCTLLPLHYQGFEFRASKCRI